MALKSDRRPEPALRVPPAHRGGNLGGAQDLNVMLHDLGLLNEDVSSHYTNNTRNGVSMLQQQLVANGTYHGVPHGKFLEDTREALLADESFPTVAV